MQECRRCGGPVATPFCRTCGHASGIPETQADYAMPVGPAQAQAQAFTSPVAQPTNAAAPVGAPVVAVPVAAAPLVSPIANAAPLSASFANPFEGLPAGTHAVGVSAAGTPMTTAWTTPTATSGSAQALDAVRVLVGALVHYPLWLLFIGTAFWTGFYPSWLMNDGWTSIVVCAAAFTLGVLLLPRPIGRRLGGVAIGLIGFAVAAVFLQVIQVPVPSWVVLLAAPILICLGWCVAAGRGVWSLAVAGVWVALLMGDGLVLTFHSNVSLIVEAVVWFGLAVAVALVPASTRTANAAAGGGSPGLALSGYPQPGGATGVQVAAAQRTNTLAVAAFVMSFIFSIAAVILGHLALRDINRTGEQGRGLAVAALVIGYASIAATVAVIIWFVALYQSVTAGY